MDGSDERYEEGGYAWELEDVVDWSERPVVLGSEHEVYEEDCDESEDNAC